MRFTRPFQRLVRQGALATLVFGAAAGLPAAETGVVGNYRSLDAGNKVGEQNAFSKAGAAISKSASKFTDSVKSAFKKKPKNDPPSVEDFGNTERSRDPDPSLYVAFAHLQEQQNNLANAEQQYKKALEKDPKFFDALVGLAHLYEAQGQLAKAHELYVTAVENYPDRAAAHNGLALCLASEGRSAEALAEFEQAIALDPDSKLYRNNIARELIRGGHPREAYAQLRSVYDSAVSYYNMGFLFNEKGDQRAALYHFHKAVELNPNFQQAQQWCAALSPRFGNGANLANRPRQPHLSQQIVGAEYAPQDKQPPVYTAMSPGPPAGGPPPTGLPRTEPATTSAEMAPSDVTPIPIDAHGRPVAPPTPAINPTAPGINQGAATATSDDAGMVVIHGGPTNRQQRPAPAGPGLAPTRKVTVNGVTTQGGNNSTRLVVPEGGQRSTIRVAEPAESAGDNAPGTVTISSPAP